MFNPLVGTTSESGRLLIWAQRPKASGDSRVCSAVPCLEIFVNIASQRELQVLLSIWRPLIHFEVVCSCFRAKFGGVVFVIIKIQSYDLQTDGEPFQVFNREDIQPREAIDSSDGSDIDVSSFLHILLFISMKSMHWLQRYGLSNTHTQQKCKFSPFSLPKWE